MRKIYSAFFVVGLLFTTFTNAQQLQDFPTKKKPVQTIGLRPSSDKCGFAYMMAQAKAAGFNDELYEQEMNRMIRERRATNPTGRPTAIYTVPVIFHISYNGTTEAAIGTGSNITATQVQAQIDQLNSDFADLSGSVYAVAEDMGIRFVAAKVSPTGTLLCEPGIERIDWTTKTGWLDPNSFTTETGLMTHYNSVVKPQSIWDPYRYLNIWLGAFDASGLLGYATFPANSTLPGLSNTETDLDAGVVILTGSVGSTTLPGSAAPYDMGRTMTHELGHFFGLRHITGDAACGNDFCADTPPQDALTGGCPPAGSLNGCVPSVPKMFENYMDYTDDACLNTFTLNQSQRAQTVMANSPRRITLATSTAVNSPIPNRIFFKGAATSTVSETGTGTCPRFKDVTVTVGIDNAATGNATVTLTKSGTATDGADYIITPASVTYTNGDGLDKTFTVRVYDDPTVEGSETISLALSLSSGTGVVVSAACPAVNQKTITIADDDYLVGVNNTTATTTLLSENFGTVTGSNQVPTGWTVSNSGLTTNKWVVNNAGAATYGFTGNTLHISNGAAAAVTNGTAPASYTITATTDARVTTPTLNATGLKNLKLSFNYVCNGELDAGTYYDLGLVYYSIDGLNYSLLTNAGGNFIIFQGSTIKIPFNITLPASATGTPTLKFLFRWLNDDSFGNQPPFMIDDVVVTGDALSVETQLNNTGTEFVATNAGASTILSADGQIIARLTNLSQNIGCLNGNVSSAGVGQQDVTTTSGTFKRSDKVIKLTPTAANTTATYQVTLYYTTAELAVWGANVPLLKILKVKDGVSLTSVLNSTNAQVYTPTVDDQRTTKGYVSYTANITGGFSQFMLASPTIVIPVTLLSFEARGNGKNILLNWSTATEINNKGFVIERSLDGNQFVKIGWIDGKVNSNLTTRYQYADNFVQPNVVYYYRLRQTDLDGREKISETKNARIAASAIEVSISPNPAKDQLKVFVSGTTGLSDINLVNAKGQLVRNWKMINTISAPALLDIRGMAPGVYMVQIITPESTSVEKLIIK